MEAILETCICYGIVRPVTLHVMPRQPTRSLLSPSVLLSFAAIYLIWGSTYLAILIGIETVPPFLLAGTRFLLAGAALYAFLRWRGEPRPSRANWRAAAVIGGLMMFGGNGLVTWAEQLVPSGLAALLVATVPVWMVVLDATVYRRTGSGRRPSHWISLGLLLALVGIGVLAEPGRGVVAPLGALVLVLASFSWANGSLLNRSLPVARSPWMAAATQMLAGGGILLVAATAGGEWSRLDLAAVSGRSLAALAYLTVFGSILALTAYVHLLRVQTAAAVSTYAFVNPVIALALGWLAGETLGPRALAGAALVVGAVVLIHWAQQRPARSSGGEPERAAGTVCAEAAAES